MANPFSVEEVTAPGDMEAAHQRARRGRENSAWLEEHWCDLMPAARGRFVAVAGGQGFVADSIEEAWTWVDEHHRGDEGAFVQYVPDVQGPRIYADRWQLAPV